MRLSLSISAAVVLIASLLLPPAAGLAVSSDHLLLTEVVYDPALTEPEGEWIELFNPTGASVSLSGWKLRDNRSEDALPEFILSPGHFLVVAASGTAFLAAYPGFGGNLVSIEGAIGNGLANGGDQIVLLDSQGAQVDAMSYGSDSTVFNPGCAGVSEGESLARWPNDADTDRASDWTAQPQPDPGSAVSPPATPTQSPTSPGTPSPTPSPTRTLTPTPGTWPKLLITELEYDSSQEGTDSDYEWLELLNPTETTVSLAGWRVADAIGSDALPSYELPPGAYLVVAAKVDGFSTNYPGFGGRIVALESPIGNGLSNTGDVAKLLAPDGAVIDALSYGSDKSVFDPPCPDVPPGQSLARAPGAPDTDSAADWLVQDPPNPGEQAIPATATPTATATHTATPGVETATSTPVSPTPSLTSTPSATGTRTIYLPFAVRLNEILPAPSAVDWNNDGTINSDDEWLELHNPTAAPVDLTGWQLDDVAAGGSKPFTLPPGSVIAAQGFVLVFHGQSRVSLNNDGDTVRLLTPEGSEADVFHYTSTRYDRSFSRLNDAPISWTEDYAPSPGAANLAPPPTPTATPTATATAVPEGVFLNEILPNPRAVDWDADSLIGWRDEWVELFNASMEPVALGLWVLRDDTSSYVIPDGTIVWPQSHLLLFRRQTGLALGDWQDELTLVRPDGLTADHAWYDFTPGEDRSYGRSEDGGGYWTKECEVTPGRANRLIAKPVQPPAHPTPVRATSAPSSVVSARAAARDTQVTVTGMVSLPPGIFSRAFYLQDSTGGIRIYLRSGEFPALAVGHRVQVRGWTRDAFGHREISVPDPSYLVLLPAALSVQPIMVRTGSIGTEVEGSLVWTVGRLVRFGTRFLVIDDGTGPSEMYFPETLGWRRPYVNKGETWSVNGVVTAFQNPDGVVRYQIVPRFARDVSDAPVFMPVTGQSTSQAGSLVANNAKTER
jgi:DNA/RNA endonuclease YhcR with UshA esterase domain